mmetsp:Transcript_24290/g.53492  ORF Transcript_24290/g.53492 Transcript_24290/m.53492 type:complete len:111 (-) Transcript_24290:965-1297(-)
MIIHYYQEMIKNSSRSTTSSKILLIFSITLVQSDDKCMREDGVKKITPPATILDEAQSSSLAKTLLVLLPSSPPQSVREYPYSMKTHKYNAVIDHQIDGRGRGVRITRIG